MSNYKIEDDYTQEDDSMEIDKSETETDIDELISDFEKVSFFGDQKRYMELYDNSKLEISDFETEEEIEIVLDKTFKRYRIYLKNIGYMDKEIFYDLEKFIRKFQDYENVDDTELFGFMNYIDNKILDKINESKEPRYWFTYRGNVAG
ncbi:MAG TPA: hypothetical protein DD806_00545 [Flavobacterium sp.]|nr:hypothetical protein [Flavobacterium sp.]